MALTPKHLSDVCMFNGESACCRYLDEEQNDKGEIVFVCKKLSADKQQIDFEIEEFYKRSKRNGTNPNDSKFPLGDNCDGYIKLLTKPQGYDVKK